MQNPYVAAIVYADERCHCDPSQTGNSVAARAGEPTKWLGRIEFAAKPVPPAFFHVPGVPAAVQIHIAPARSTMKSPTAKVPDVGAPEAVAPAYLDVCVAPVSASGT